MFAFFATAVKSRNLHRANSEYKRLLLTQRVLCGVWWSGWSGEMQKLKLTKTVPLVESQIFSPANIRRSRGHPRIPIFFRNENLTYPGGGGLGHVRFPKKY